jgi:hypothetical protein
MKIITKYKNRKNCILTLLRSYGLTLLFVLCFCLVYGQTSTGEAPVSLTREVPALRINEQTHKVLPLLDMAKIEQETRRMQKMERFLVLE